MVDMTKTPYYIAHMDDGENPDNTNAIVPNADGMTLNGTQYYSQTKVDQLLSAKDSELRLWATETFQTKSE